MSESSLVREGTATDSGSPNGRWTKPIFSACVLVLAVAYAGLSLRLTFREGNGQPGAGFFPVCLAAFFVACAAVSLVREVIGRRTELGDRAGGEDRAHVRDCAVMMLMTLAFVVLFFVIGAIPATVIFCAAATLVLARDHRIRSILIVLPVPIGVVLALNALTGGALISF